METPSSASAEKPKALFLSPESPYPTHGGGPLRSASLVEYLSRRFAVHAIVFHQPSDPEPASAIPAGLVERLDVLELPHHSKHSFARAARNSIRVLRNRPPLWDRFSGFEKAIAKRISGRQYEAAIIEHFWCAHYIDQVRSQSKMVILDLHNIESVWHHGLAKVERGARALALRRFATASVALERRYFPAFDRLLVASPEDEEAERELAPRTNVTVYPNALPLIALPERRERREIVFSGNLEYAPNVQAVWFFHRHVWPQLRSRWPDLKWKIVGKNPEAVRRIVRVDSQIVLTGAVSDAVEALANAQVAVVPVLAGSGTRIKILEAWAAGTAVVSTTLGAQGLNARPGEDLLIADDPTAFAAAVSRLLEDAGTRQRIGAAGRKLYEERFTWPVAWRRLDGVFRNETAAGSV